TRTLHPWQELIDATPFVHELRVGLIQLLQVGALGVQDTLERVTRLGDFMERDTVCVYAAARHDSRHIAEPRERVARVLDGHRCLRLVEADRRRFLES